MFWITVQIQCMFSSKSCLARSDRAGIASCVACLSTGRHSVSTSDCLVTHLGRRASLEESRQNRNRKFCGLGNIFMKHPRSASYCRGASWFSRPPAGFFLAYNDCFVALGLVLVASASVLFLYEKAKTMAPLEIRRKKPRFQCG
jgi:hypothetical protein